MKFFLLEGTYLVPFETILSMGLVTTHRAFLQKGYDEGYFLFSGPQVPAQGGFLVARAESREALDALLAEEPYVKAGVMRFSRIVEFNPAQMHGDARQWFDAR